MMILMLVLMIFVNSIDAYIEADTDIIMMAKIFIEVLLSGLVPTSIQQLSLDHTSSLLLVLMMILMLMLIIFVSIDSIDAYIDS